MDAGEEKQEGGKRSKRFRGKKSGKGRRREQTERAEEDKKKENLKLEKEQIGEVTRG